MSTVPVENPSPRMFCGECGGSYPIGDLSRFGNSFVCVNCKPGYLRRQREGGAPAAPVLSGVRYGGFWIRGLALLIDGLIVGIVTAPILIALGLGTGSLQNLDAENPPFGFLGLAQLFSVGLLWAYQVWFLTNKGGTPGKLVLGLRVITPDGNNLTAGRATARYFAYTLNLFTLYIGFIIAAFDSEKRALHDFICNTRVIRR